MKEIIENLISRLEELRNDKYVNGVDRFTTREKRVFDIAEEIVNQLAEEYNNDVCEWEKGSSGYVGYPAYYSRCCTTNSKGLEMQTHIISDWKFCPYCGKKIKVVE